jgi:uncharacterized protein YifN (PemK superfamily)
MTCRSSRRCRSPCSAWSSFLQGHLARERGWVAQGDALGSYRGTNSRDNARSKSGTPMTINFKPRVGQILVCDYGLYPAPPDPQTAHGRLPPEMIKKRLVVVLNAKHQHACVVVPLSTTQDVASVTRGFHVPIPAGTLPAINYWDDCDRWAKCDIIQMVSNLRLDRVMEQRGHAAACLPAATVTEIQRGVIKVIGGAGTFLSPPQPAHAHPGAPPVASSAPDPATEATV